VDILIAPNIQTLDVYVPGKPIEETQREFGLHRVIKLASNENPLGPSPKAIAAMQHVLPELHRYPDGSGFHLKQALSQKFKLPVERFILGNGSNEILEFICRAVAQPGDNAVMGWPSFVIYHYCAQAANLEVRHAPMPNYQYDVSALIDVIDERTKVVLIGHPSNPTGTYLAKTDLHRLLKHLPSTAVLIIDEAYVEYVDTPDYESGIACLHPNVMVLRTFSKVYGLAGMRLGFGVGDSEFISYLNRIREPFNTNSLALVGAQAALLDDEHVQRCVAENKHERARISRALTQLGAKVVPSQTNFVLAEFDRPALPLFQALLQRGVITRPMTVYHLPNSLRISFGVREENDRLLALMAELL